MPPALRDRHGLEESGEAVLVDRGRAGIPLRLDELPTAVGSLYHEVDARIAQTVAIFRVLVFVLLLVPADPAEPMLVPLADDAHPPENGLGDVAPEIRLPPV